MLLPRNVRCISDYRDWYSTRAARSSSAGYGFGEQRTASAREIAKCAASGKRRGEEEEVRLLKVLAPVPRHIHLARPPRTCVHVRLSLALSANVCVRIGEGEGVHAYVHRIRFILTRMTDEFLCRDPEISHLDLTSRRRLLRDTGRRRLGPAQLLKPKSILMHVSLFLTAIEKNSYSTF